MDILAVWRFLCGQAPLWVTLLVVGGAAGILELVPVLRNMRFVKWLMLLISVAVLLSIVAACTGGASTESGVPEETSNAPLFELRVQIHADPYHVTLTQGDTVVDIGPEEKDDFYRSLDSELEKLSQSGKCSKVSITNCNLPGIREHFRKVLTERFGADIQFEYIFEENL